MKNSPLSIIKHFPDFLDYLEIEKGLSSKTQENYARYLNRFEKWLIAEKHENLLPNQLTSEIVWDYRVFLSRKTLSAGSKEPLKKSTQNYYLIAVRALLSYFTDRDITSLPSDKIKLAKQENEHGIHFLTIEKVKKLLESPEKNVEAGMRDRAILETLFSTGLRVSELVALDRDEFSNMKKDFLETNITGKGNKTRTIYFSKRSLDSIKDYLKARTDLDPALFINYRPGAENMETRRLTTRSVESIVKKYVNLAGLPHETTPHTLRHSFATDLLNQGVDLRMVQEFLGHSDISTTQIYTHVTNKKLSDIYKKFHAKDGL